MLKINLFYSTQVTRFLGSNPADVEGMFQEVKISSTRPLGGTFNPGSESEISGLLKKTQAWKKTF